MPALFLHGRDDEPEQQPPSTFPFRGSYIFLLLLIVAASAGVVVWTRRQQRSTGAFGLQNFSSGPAAVRLSVDDDGPATHSFIVNNGSTDSLPAHALTDLPELTHGRLSSSHLPLHPANSSSNPSSSHSLSDSYTLPERRAPFGTAEAQSQSDTKAKTAPRSRGPGERDEDHDNVDTGRAGSVFDIGDDDDDDDETH